MKGPTPRKLLHFASVGLRLKKYLRSPGDGRPRPQIAAHNLVWALLVGLILRRTSFHAIEGAVRSRARRGLGVTRSFGDDALGYFAERLDPQVTRAALAQAVKAAKRNKAFDDCYLIGLALDGTGAGRCSEKGCDLCHEVRDEKKNVLSHIHHFCMVSVIGADFTLPIDVEPYGPGDCEYNAGQRLMARAVENLGSRFASFVVVDGEYATAPFLHAAGDVGLHVLARLKGNLPLLLAAAEARFAQTPPKVVTDVDGDQVELWDADDFDPWDTLRWQTVRVLRYRQHKPDGTLVEAYWLTDFSMGRAGTVTLYRCAKSRWRAIENQGFNVGKTYYGLEHIPRHHANALLVWWLMVTLALTVERLYRMRYLRRGVHQPHTSAKLVLLLWLAVGLAQRRDSG